MYQEAILDFNVTIKLRPLDINAYMNKGLALLYLKDYKAARDVYTKVIGLNDHDAEAYLNRGVAFQYDGLSSMACEDWKTSSALGSEKAGSFVEKYCSP